MPLFCRPAAVPTMSAGKEGVMGESDVSVGSARRTLVIFTCRDDRLPSSAGCSETLVLLLAPPPTARNASPSPPSPEAPPDPECPPTLPPLGPFPDCFPRGRGDRPGDENRPTPALEEAPPLPPPRRAAAEDDDEATLRFAARGEDGGELEEEGMRVLPAPPLADLAGVRLALNLAGKNARRQLKTRPRAPSDDA